MAWDRCPKALLRSIANKAIFPACSWGPGRTAAELLTWQPIDEPCQLFFRDVGPTEVEANWLPLDDATESLGYNSLTSTQVNFCPKSLVAAPVTEGKRTSCKKSDTSCQRSSHHRLLKAVLEGHPP